MSKVIPSLKALLNITFAFNAWTPLVGRQYGHPVCNKSSAVAETGDRGHNRHEPKRGGLLLRAGTPSNTMWPWPRSTSVPSGVFIHPAIWPQ